VLSKAKSGLTNPESFEGAMIIPLHTSSFLFNGLGFLFIPGKSLIPTFVVLKELGLQLPCPTL
jgi:hypothetical protein